MNILVLCHGNINRSALCAEILRTELKTRATVIGAALKESWRRPERAAKKMRDAAEQRGYSLGTHRSQPCTQELVDWADLILYFDNGNEERLAKFRSHRGKCQRVGSFLLNPKPVIKDPAFYPRGSAEFEAVVAEVVEASRRLAQEILVTQAGG